MSEDVERRLIDVLGNPTVSPYGNPIPGLGELGGPDGVIDGANGAGTESLVSLDQVDVSRGSVVVRRLAEPLQADAVLMSRLRRAGVRPGASVSVGPAPAGLLVGSGGESTEISSEVASHIFVTAR